MSMLMKAAAGTGIEWEMVAAIGLRESAFRNGDEVGGGGGRGIFQIDSGQHSEVSDKDAYDPVWAAHWVATLLEANMTNLSYAHPNLNSTQLLQATAASYNFGTTNISGDPDKIDVGTKRDNYGSNILNLMDCFL